MARSLQVAGVRWCVIGYVQSCLFASFLVHQFVARLEDAGLGPFSSAPARIPAIVSYHLKMLVRKVMGDGGDEFLVGKDLEILLFFPRVMSDR